MEILGLYYVGICTCFVQYFWTGLWLIPLVHSSRYNRPQNDVADWQLPQTTDYCRSHNWFTDRQRKLCELHPSLLPSVMEGAMEAITECRYQFREKRWNCPVSNVTAVFGRSKLRTRNPEMAYLQAVTSAGVTFTVTRACGSGQIVECGCDNRIDGDGEEEKGTEWEWGGCSDDIRFGMYFSRDFVDASEEGDTSASMMTLHNYEAGRKAIEESMEIKCKCHGVSGSCTSKICWNSMTKFRLVGKQIYSRYQQAYHMRYSKKRKQLRPIQERSQKPTTSDLVYLRSSPDYCEPNKRHGSLGTHGRFCTDNCSQMCCGRGYQTMERKGTESCNCRFHWCCEVECDTCETVRQLRVCN